MKNTFVKYLRGAIAKNEALLTNSLTDEEKKLVEDTIAELNAIVTEIENLPEDKSGEAVEALKETVENLEQSLRAMSEKLNLIKREETTEIMENNYLKSKQAFADFANVIRNSKTGSELKEAWDAVLIENGITITEGAEEAYLPEAVRSKIQSIWEEGAGFLKKLNYTNAKKFKLRFNSGAQNALASRAKGHKKGNTKTAQTLTLNAKTITPAMLYKLQIVDIQTEWEDAQLVDFVINELGNQILWEMKVCIVGGDGRDTTLEGGAANPDKIDAFEAIGAKTTTDAYTTVVTPEAGSFLIENLLKTIDTIYNPMNKEVICFVSKQNYRTLTKISGGEGVTPVFADKGYLESQLGATIEVVDYMPSGVDAVCFIPSEYYIVGLQSDILNPELTTDHNIMTNENIYRKECMVGGGANLLSSAVLLAAGE